MVPSALMGHVKFLMAAINSVFCNGKKISSLKLVNITIQVNVQLN